MKYIERGDIEKNKRAECGKRIGINKRTRQNVSINYKLKDLGYEYITLQCCQIVWIKKQIIEGKLTYILNSVRSFVNNCPNF